MRTGCLRGAAAAQRAHVQGRARRILPGGHPGPQALPLYDSLLPPLPAQRARQPAKALG